MASIDYITLPSQLLCPRIRMENIEGRFRKIKLGERFYLIIDSSCYLSDAREDEKSSHHHLNHLFWCNNKEGKDNDFLCDACWQYTIGTIYYHCNGCGHSYHKECVESPSVFISPYHPKFPLQLVKFFALYPLKCHYCGNRIRNLAYYSSIRDLILDPVCANKREIPVINNQKRHEHMLHYFPRKASLTCDVCGTDDNKICFYICHQCDFVVHRTCIHLPRVIQISRHKHRLLFTSSLSSGRWSCKVCRQKIDESYGEYSCSMGCVYAVHSKCATLPDVWDGKELEDEPEKVYDNIQPWKDMGEGFIQHFSHPHHNMRFDKDIDNAYREKKQCEACLLSLYNGGICGCMQCDFVLHEACANLPRIKQNMLHPHQFILQTGNSKNAFLCVSCYRISCGFRYKCCEEYCSMILDVRCASLSEPVYHPSHPHPLFLLNLRRYQELCSICGIQFDRHLNCLKCVFALCFHCATLPYRVKHEDDEHLLSLSYKKDTIYPCWCEACEEQMDPKKGYYTCRKCGTTIHIECLLGYDPYMKPGAIIDEGMKVEIIPNNCFTRPICSYCKRRCQCKIVCRRYDGKIFCSLLEAYTIVIIPETR